MDFFDAVEAIIIPVFLADGIASQSTEIDGSLGIVNADWIGDARSGSIFGTLVDKLDGGDGFLLPNFFELVL